MEQNFEHDSSANGTIYDYVSTKLDKLTDQDLNFRSGIEDKDAHKFASVNFRIGYIKKEDGWQAI